MVDTKINIKINTSWYMKREKDLLYFWFVFHYCKEELALASYKTSYKFRIKFEIRSQSVFNKPYHYHYLFLLILFGVEKEISQRNGCDFYEICETRGCCHRFGGEWSSRVFRSYVIGARKYPDWFNRFRHESRPFSP